MTSSNVDLLQPPKRFTPKKWGWSGKWNVRTVALLTGLMGLINLLSTVTPSLADRLAILRPFSPLAVRHGGHLTAALAGFALLLLADDKSYYFSPGGSVIAYAARSGVAIALGDPIGPPEDIAVAIAGFVAFCARNDWQSAFHETLPDYLDYYQVVGLQTLCIGYVGSVDLADFTLAGKANQTLRYPVNHLTKLGYRAEIHQPPLSTTLLAELRAISDEWLTMVRGAEKRFMLGWFDDDYIRNGPVIAVHTPEGQVDAFANIVLEYQCNEITVDLMRHRADVENGTMDFLFVSLGKWARAQGYASFGLGLSPLWRVGEHDDDPSVECALHYIYEHLNQFYNFKGLHEFKEKFHPHWSPRYLIYPGPASLPAVLTSLIQVSSGDNFVWAYLKDFVSK